MKVLQINKFYHPKIGGVEKVVQDIAEGLNSIGVKTDVLCMQSQTGKKDTEELINNTKIFRQKILFKISGTAFSLSLINKLLKIKNNYEIIHVHHPDPMGALAILIANPKAKIILHWHSDIIKQKFLKKLFLPLQNALLKKAHTIITTTSKYAKHSKDLKKYQNKCKTVYIGINKDKLQPNKDLVDKIKQKYKGKKIIFSIGRLVEYKGFKYLIEASKYLDESFQIIIAGDGPLKYELELLAKKYKNVELIGKLTDKELASYYSTSDLFVLPSITKNEAFGVVQIEAMSFGLPIVSTSVHGSGIDEVNQDGVTGIVVKPKDSQQIAKAIRKILNNENLYKTFSKNSLKRFNELFIQKRMINKIIKIYKN